jgi:hypothetical protein
MPNLINILLCSYILSKTIDKSFRLNWPIGINKDTGSIVFTGKMVYKMFAKLKKIRLSLKPKLFIIRWFPSSRSCVKPGNRKVKPQQMPPLMVRKAEWRR